MDRARIFCLMLSTVVLPACSNGEMAQTSDGPPPGHDGSGALPDMMMSEGDGPGPTGSLYPLAVGYTWTYDVQQVGGGAVCAPGRHDAQVTGMKRIDGKDAFAMTSFCSAITGPSYVAPEGERVLFDYNASWAPLIDIPIEEGHRWTYFNTSYTWHHEGAVTVPAGTFSECWTARQNVSYTAYLTYCRGAGLLRSYSSDLLGNGWDAKLTSKSF